MAKMRISIITLLIIVVLSILLGICLTLKRLVDTAIGKIVVEKRDNGPDKITIIFNDDNIDSIYESPFGIMRIQNIDAEDKNEKQEKQKE